MKKKINILGVAALLTAGSLFLLNSCDKIIAIDLNKDYANIDFVISAPQAAGTIVINEEVLSDLESLASSQGFDIDKIESAQIKSITMKINDTDPVPVTTAIVQSVTTSISSDNSNFTEIATEDANHTSSTQMDLDLKGGVDIAPYLKSSKFTIRAEITTNAPITHNVPVNMSMSCSFKVKPFKK
jgi:hypothetical protein